MNLVEIRDLVKHFKVRNGLTKAVDGVSLDIRRGETLGLIGESGCGKTTLGRLLVRLIKPTSGYIMFDGVEITRIPERKIRPFRKRFQIVFQDPYSSLNPRMTVSEILSRPLKIFTTMKKEHIIRKVIRILEEVGLGLEHLNRYPHEFSGGQRQRIAIARALILDPDFVVLDEPTSALDVSVQAQILNLLKDLRIRHKITYLFISHDMSVIRYMSDRVAVMYLGKIVEEARVEELFENPMHPYTKLLTESILDPDPDSIKIADIEVPDVEIPDSGCRYHPRCPIRTSRCVVEEPDLVDVGNDHRVRCFIKNG